MITSQLTDDNIAATWSAGRPGKVYAIKNLLWQLKREKHKGCCKQQKQSVIITHKCLLSWKLVLQLGPTRREDQSLNLQSKHLQVLCSFFVWHFFPLQERKNYQHTLKLPWCNTEKQSINFNGLHYYYIYRIWHKLLNMVFYEMSNRKCYSISQAL